MPSLARTLFFTCFGCSGRLGRPAEPRLPTREMKEHDRRVVWTTGRTFEMELLGSKEIQDDHEIAQVEETASAIIFAAIKDPALQKTVQLTIAPTRVHVVETEPWAILYDHPVATVTNLFLPFCDRRLLMYSVTNPVDEKTVLFCFQTGSETEVVGLQVFRAIEYAMWCWKERTLWKDPDNRVVELRKKYEAKMSDNCSSYKETVDLSIELAIEDESSSAVEPPEASTEQNEEQKSVESFTKKKYEAKAKMSDNCSSDKETVDLSIELAIEDESSSAVEPPEASTEQNEKQKSVESFTKPDEDEEEPSPTPADDKATTPAESDHDSITNAPSPPILSAQPEEPSSTAIYTSVLQEMVSHEQAEGPYASRECAASDPEGNEKQTTGSTTERSNDRQIIKKLSKPITPATKIELGICKKLWKNVTEKFQNISSGSKKDAGLAKKRKNRRL